MKQPFKRIILYARQHRSNQGVSESLDRLLVFLRTQPVSILQEKQTADAFDLPIPVLDKNDLGTPQDLIVVVGGDGSLLSAAKMAITINAPVIGINRGRLGFLTDILPQNIESELSAILQGLYKEEQRFLLHARIYDMETTYFEGDALNDIVLSRGGETHLADFDVYVDGQLMSNFRSDGLIISTPTGSTAYALSAGGPIMHPKLNAMVIVPMFSHTLSSRPLVVDGQVNIQLHISETNEASMRISCDAQQSKTVKPGQRVSVIKNAVPLRLLHPLHYHYYDTLRSKLGWESNYQG